MKIRNVNRSPVVVVLNIALTIMKALIDPEKVPGSWVTITLDVYLGVDLVLGYLGVDFGVGESVAVSHGSVGLVAVLCA